MIRLGTVAKILSATCGFVALYLAVAMAWASCAIDALVPADPAPAAMPAPELTPHQAALLLAIEDPTFYTHRGLDLSNGQGVTTITSSLAGSLLIHGRPLAGAAGRLQRFYAWINDRFKAIDLGRDAMAIVLDRRVPKARQLALYEGSVYFGTWDGAPLLGFASAASTFFGVRADGLSDMQTLNLVTRIKAPDFFRPDRHPAAFAARLARVRAVAEGRCRPDGWFDTDYASCPAT